MTSTILKWVSGGLEAFWGIPILGGTIILSLGWIPLGIMFFLHVATLIFAVTRRTENSRKYYRNCC